MNKWWTRAALGLVWALIATSIVTLGGDPPPVALTRAASPGLPVTSKHFRSLDVSFPAAEAGCETASTAVKASIDVEASTPIPRVITML